MGRRRKPRNSIDNFDEGALYNELQKDKKFPPTPNELIDRGLRILDKQMTIIEQTTKANVMSIEDNEMLNRNIRTCALIAKARKDALGPGGEEFEDTDTLEELAGSKPQENGEIADEADT